MNLLSLVFEYNQYIRGDISNIVSGWDKKGAFSVSPPLHESLIVTTDREEVSIIAIESDSHDMLGVTSERDGHVTFSARVSEDIYESVIVCSDD